MSSNMYGPQQARLDNKEWPQGWIADARDKNPWLKIKLNGRHIVSGIATQGYGNKLFSDWVKSYQVSWYDPKHKGFIIYREQGNEKVKHLYSRNHGLRFPAKNPIWYLNYEKAIV